MSAVKADRDVCRGFANCVMTAPDYFDLDDDGLVVVTREQVRESDESQVDAAVVSCPVSALKLEHQ